MQKDACCTGTGMCKWICPSITGVVAGLIVISAGLLKFLGHKAYLTMVGGMALSVVGIHGHSKIALVLGLIAATIEVLGGISFAIGCRKTSRYAAFALAGVMGIAILFKLTHLEPLAGNLFYKAAGLLGQIQIELLLFAVFFHKALKLIMGWFGKDCGSYCTTEAPKKK